MKPFTLTRQQSLAFLFIMSLGLVTLVGSGGGDSASSSWAWVDGSTTINQSGTYGTEDTAAAGNVPGARQGSVRWIDGSGNLWLFGGYGRDSAGNLGYLNDLWGFNPATGQWTWVDGSDIRIQSGTYGTEDVAAAGNVPGARGYSVSWIDGSGNLWLFGGYGYDIAGNQGYLNDLWRFNPTSGEWTWVDGNDTVNQSGVYGTEDVAAAGNVPGARGYSVSWIDGSDNLWLFGGYGRDSAGAEGQLNDLWRFNPTTGQWTWVDGSDIRIQSGTYGTEDTAAAGNVPGARSGSMGWIDGSGNFWLFGGNGYDSAGSLGYLNDLWSFNPTTGQWTWVDGNDTVNQSGVYGTEDAAAAGNVPGARGYSVSWIDGSDNLWLFGGYGRDSAGAEGQLNDLWRFNPTTGQWTWVDGSNTRYQSGTYGTEDTAAAGNVPGARGYSVSWIDVGGNLWLFGGEGYDSAGNLGYLNDLWRFRP